MSVAVFQGSREEPEIAQKILCKVIKTSFGCQEPQYHSRIQLSFQDLGRSPVKYRSSHGYLHAYSHCMCHEICCM